MEMSLASVMIAENRRGKTMRIGVNGLGRIGKLVLRRLADLGLIEHVVWINDLVGDAAAHAHFLEFDSVQGRWAVPLGGQGDRLTVAGHEISVLNRATPADLPLGDIDLVIECSGQHKAAATLQPYRDADVRILVSAPVKDGHALNLVYGVNHDQYDAAQHDLVTAASCTTNCLAPVVKVVLDSFGIRHGAITTLHDVTNTQVVVDKPMKDLRRARSALTNLIPTTTGSATAITLIYPQLQGRLNGHAVRVPMLNASLTDCVFELERETSPEALNHAFATAAAGPLRDILGVEHRPLVSSDYVGDSRSAIIDAPSTMVVNGTQAKIFAWYDNEWAYSCRVVDIARMIARI